MLEQFPNLSASGSQSVLDLASSNPANEAPVTLWDVTDQ